MKIISLLLFSMFLTISCCKHDNEGTVCFGFDQRQCGVDEWADIIPESDTAQQREDKMEIYLVSKGIAVKEVNLVLNFLDGVCEACGVCPTGDRFFIKTYEEDTSKLEELELLNLEKEDCSDHF